MMSAACTRPRTTLQGTQDPKVRSFAIGSNVFDFSGAILESYFVIDRLGGCVCVTIILSLQTLFVTCFLNYNQVCKVDLLNWTK